MTKFLALNLFPGIFFEDDFPIDYHGSNVLRCRWSFDLAPGMSYRVNGVQVVTERQKGLGNSLAPYIFTSSYPSNVGKIQELYDKVMRMEKILRAHGLAEN